MTKHGHFEDLIFSEKSLTSAEQNSLIEHLKTCPECKTLYHSWQLIHAHIQSVKMIRPSENFIETWNVQLGNRKMYARKIQTRKMILISFAGTFLALMIASVLTMVLTSPIDLIISLIKSLNNLVLLINLLGTFTITLLQVIPLFIPLYYTYVIISAFCLLTILWILSIWRFSKQGVNTK